MSERPTHEGFVARVHVIGTLRISGPNRMPIAVPRRAHDLIAVLAAAGPDGIGRDAMAAELWGQQRPDSWMSALRNRAAAARKALGQHAIVNEGRHFRFGPQIRVDSWDLISHRVEADDPTNELWFLDGDLLIDIADSALRRAHISDVHQARVALIDTTLQQGRPLSPRALQSLRIYQQAHPHDAPITSTTIRAHIQAGNHDRAAAILNDFRAVAADTGHLLDSIPRLEHLLAEQSANSLDPELEPPQVVDRRAVLFDQAKHSQNWSLALEIALEGLPAAERIGGDPERLALLEAIPGDGLEGSRKFTHAMALARHLMYAGRESEAQSWSALARGYATTPNEVLLSYITRAIVGDIGDERAPMKLPDTFRTAPTESIGCRSLQVAVMSHLERDSYETSLELFHRFRSAIEGNGDPYRRWHLLLLESMYAFVDGRLQEAADAARAAQNFAELFGIVDGEIALIGQLSNAQVLDPQLPGIDDYVNNYPTSASSKLSQALQAVADTRRHGGTAVDDFLNTFNYQSRTFFTFPIVALTAPYVVDPGLRSKLINRLRDRTGTSAIWGSGVLHLGPVDRTLAGLTDQPTQAATLLTDAVRLADYQRTRVWQVICRLDLAAITGNAEHRAHAEDLATTPELRRLLTTYEPLRPS